MPNSPSRSQAESWKRPHLAYLFERFPTFTQTFCVREIIELQRQGLRPLLFSIRDTRDEPLQDHFPASLAERVHFLPQGKDLVAEVTRMKDADQLPQEVVLTLRHWGDAPDKMRVYEAAYVGMKMREAGVWHAHAHFAGVGARACWWLQQFFGMQYSFTGHANDIFEDAGHAVSLEKLVEDAVMVVTVSDYTAAYLRQKFPRASGKVKRVYNGLGLEPFTAVSGDRTEVEGRPMILSVGRLIEKKGFDDLVRVCAQMKLLGYEDFDCIIVGDGPMEAELEGLVDELEVGECVKLAGAKSQPEIVDLLGRAQVFVLPCVTEKSGGKDNLPTVIMEAMAAGLPCVSTRLAGVPEMVVDGETGLLVGERQPQAFAEAVVRLLNDSEMRVRMGDAGRKRAREVFDQSVTAKSLARKFVRCGATPFDRRDPLGSVLGVVRRFVGRLRRRQVSEYVLAERKARKQRG